MSQISPKKWDQEANSIMVELVNAERVLLAKSGESYKTQTKLKSQICKYQNIIIGNFEKIIYLASPKVFLRPQEKTLLHWGIEFSEKAQTYCRELNSKILLDMWSRLIHGRLLGENSSLGHSFFTPGSRVAQLKAQRKRIARAEKEMQAKVATLSIEKDALTNRYNDLVLTRANRDASGCMQEKFGEDLSESMKNPALEAIERLLLNGSLRIRKKFHITYVIEKAKIDCLTASPTNLKNVSKNRKNKKSGSKSKNIEHLESFDVLSEKLMEMDPTSEKMRRKFGALQVKKSNKSAADISLEPIKSPDQNVIFSVSNIRQLADTSE